MENYLVDRETLGQFVDALISKKYPGQPAEIYSNVREREIAALDDHISKEIFAGLNQEQLTELNDLLDKDDGTPDAYETFFSNAGIDIEARIKGAFESFAANYLGGTNA